jgi:hypothetical protein
MVDGNVIVAVWRNLQRCGWVRRAYSNTRAVCCISVKNEEGAVLIELCLE